MFFVNIIRDQIKKILTLRHPRHTKTLEILKFYLALLDLKIFMYCGQFRN